jgi:hypothetical protein
MDRGYYSYRTGDSIVPREQDKVLEAKNYEEEKAKNIHKQDYSQAGDIHKPR